MACFGGGGGGGGSGAKAALATVQDPMISAKPFLEVKLTLGNVNTRESVLLLNEAGEYLPGAQDSNTAPKPPKKLKLPAGKSSYVPNGDG